MHTIALLVVPLLLAQVVSATPPQSPAPAPPKVPIATSTPIEKPGPIGQPAPAPRYTPIACATLVTKAGLIGKKITNESVADILAEANREHNAVLQVSKKTADGKTIVVGVPQSQGIARAVIDYYSCFEAPSPAPAAKK